jgi:hypothetical protein
MVEKWRRAMPEELRDHQYCPVGTRYRLFLNLSLNIQKRQFCGKTGIIALLNFCDELIVGHAWSAQGELSAATYNTLTWQLERTKLPCSSGLASAAR